MNFTKMLGSGKDFVFVDCFAERTPRNPNGLAVEVADRQRGIGAEALMLIEPSHVADARVRSYTSQGSETLSCRNGIRCVAKYLFDHKLCTKTRIQIEAETEVMQVDVFPHRDVAQLLKMEMGVPEFNPEKIPTTLEGNPQFQNRLVNVPIKIEGFELPVTCLAIRSEAAFLADLSSPHCVVFVEKLTDEVVVQLGQLVEMAEVFPHNINVDFVEVQSSTELRLRTWSGGVGEVIPNGLSSSAACVAGHASRRAECSVAVATSAGTLHVEWDQQQESIHLIGSAVEVFSGRWNGLS